MSDYQRHCLVIFGLLCLNFLRLDFYPNEEVQFAFAKEFFDVNWVPGYSSLEDDLGTRAVIRYMIGFTISIFDWLPSVIILRVLNYLLFAVALAKLTRALGLMSLESLILLQLFFLSPQSMIGGEWIFGGFEAKTMAYGLLFFSIYNYHKSKFTYAILLAAFASYFHLLAGFWVTVVLLLHAFIFDRNFLLTLKSGLLYSLSLAPLLTLIVLETQSNVGRIPETFSFANIYVNFRVPHHTQIFNNHQIVSLTTLGICLHALFLWVSIRLNREASSKITELWLVINAVVVLVILLAFIDEFFLADRLNHFFALYPYRLSSLSLLLGAFALPLLMTKYWNRTIIQTLIVLCLFSLGFKIYQNYEFSIWPAYSRDEHFLQVMDFVNSETANDAKFLILVDRQLPPHKAFYRLTGRNNYFVFQFTPHGMQYFYDWYIRSERYYQANNDRDHLTDHIEDDSFQYVIADSTIEEDDFELVWHDGNYWIYERKVSVEPSAA